MPAGAITASFVNAPFLSSLLAVVAEARPHGPLLHFPPPPAAPASAPPSRTSRAGSSSGATRRPPGRPPGSPPVTADALLLLLALALLIMVAREVTGIRAPAGWPRSRWLEYRPRLSLTGLKVARLNLAGAQSRILAAGGATVALLLASNASLVNSQPLSLGLTRQHGGLSATTPRSQVDESLTPPRQRLAAANRGLAARIWPELMATETEIARTANSSGLSAADQASRQVALAAEAAIFTEAAHSQTIATALVTAAQRSGDAEAMSAITANLAIVQTSVVRAAAAAQAARGLAQIGSLSPAQLAGISSGAAFVTPIVGGVSQGFGPTDFGLEGSRTVAGVFYPHFHTGLDITAPEGTPVHAAADGMVMVAGVSTGPDGRMIGYGEYVVIAHPDGFATLYGHLSALAVHAGDPVHQGEIIGYSGSTGNSTGPHLHFEIRVNGDPVDPMAYVGTELRPS